MASVLTKNKNCYRIEKAGRLSFLIDGADYFYALREALINARHSVFIFGWDINSELKLVRDENYRDDYPEKMGDFLNALAAEKEQLQIHILNWDFAMIYAPDREWLPAYHLDWKTHERIQFCLDNYLPSGASQHQKTVVIDDCLAFIGGLDLTLGRWDTSDHVAFNPKRDRAGEKICRPYHDVQVVLDGDAARALAEQVRNRWALVTGKHAPESDADRPASCWPESVPVDIENVNIGISRTQCAYKEIKQAGEIEAFYLDAIHCAQRYIYIENQYFTASGIADAIEQSLKKEQGPEVVIVVPKETNGWMSQMTMDVLRVRLFKKLVKNDKYNRLRIYFPDGPDLESNPIIVHAKLMIVDDTLVTVGSANLNNRSMGLDTECNIIVDAQSDTSIQAAIAGFRHRLIAEHTASSVQAVEEALNNSDSLCAAINELGDKKARHFQKLSLDIPDDINRLVPDADVADPEVPLEPALMMKRILPEESAPPTRARIISWLALIVSFAALAAVWQWTPLKEWVTVEAVSGLLSKVREIPASPLLVIAGFIFAGFIAFPFTLLIIATVMTYGMTLGFIYSLVGGMASALIVYGIGEKIGSNAVRKLAGSKINSISKKLAKHGIITIVAVRIVPVAPFTVVNLVAGASHIHFRDYLTGTLIGLVPGMFSVTLIADRAFAAIKNPGMNNLLILAATVAIVVLAGYFLVGWLVGKTSQDRKELI